MADTPKQEINLFYCYAREDKALREELEKHLSWLKRRYQLTNWHDREILPGEDWQHAIDTHLKTADLVLLLISPDFMNSDYCYSKEMRLALELHVAGNCCVIPILMRPTYWEGAPFSHLQLLPTNAQPVTLWPNRDEAFQEVVVEISRTIKNLLIPLKAIEEKLDDGITFSKLKQYREALTTFEQIIQFDPQYALAHLCKGLVLYTLKQYQEALVSFEHVTQYRYPFEATSRRYRKLFDIGAFQRAYKRCEMVYTAFEQVIQLNPQDAHAYHCKGLILYFFNRDQEALAAFEQLIHLEPNNAAAYFYKGRVLRNLKRHEDSLQAFEKARQLAYGSQ